MISDHTAFDNPQNIVYVLTLMKLDGASHDFLKPTGVLITGGGGFIGSNLAEHYLKKGLPVVCVDNFCTGMRANVDRLKKISSPDQFVFVEEDISKPWHWTKIISPNFIKKISHVFHLASPASPPLYQELAFETLWANSLGLNHALELGDSLGARVIYSSTSEIYGDPECSPQPESYWGRVNSFGVRSCYDESKRFGEALLFTHNWKKKTRHGLVRIFNTYGPGMNPHDGRVIINFLVQASQGKNLTVYGDGRQTRSFCYISDLVAGLVKYAESELVEPVNLGNDNEFTILDLATEVQKLFSPKEIRIQFMPLPKDDPQQRRPDLTRARAVLAPWRPQVNLAEGLQMMRKWLEK